MFGMQTLTHEVALGQEEWEDPGAEPQVPQPAGQAEEGPGASPAAAPLPGHHLSDLP